MKMVAKVALNNLRREGGNELTRTLVSLEHVLKGRGTWLWLWPMVKSFDGDTINVESWARVFEQASIAVLAFPHRKKFAVNIY